MVLPLGGTKKEEEGIANREYDFKERTPSHT